MMKIEFNAMVAVGLTGTAVMELVETEQLAEEKVSTVIDDIKLVGATQWVKELTRIANTEVELGSVYKVTGAADACDLDIQYIDATVEKLEN